MAETRPRPKAESGDRGTRPLGRRGSKLFVVIGLGIIILFALFTIYMVVRASEDPGIQQGIEDFRRDAGQRGGTPADTARDADSYPP
ncbi:MAG: hypothetical protein ACOCSK_01680 [Rhodothermales bacterium]